MSRVPWKEGKVISIETRPGLFALGQMVRSTYIAFFDAFHDSPDWPETELDGLRLLHLSPVVNQLIFRSNAKYQKHLRPATINFPTQWIRSNAFAAIRTIWTGSAKEMTVGYMGTKASLIDVGVGARGPTQTLIRRIDPQDAETIDSHNLNAMVAYPYQNERLYLCHLLGRNVDVIKDLIFKRELPAEYETFLRYISISSEQVQQYKPGAVEIDPPMPHGQGPRSELNR